MFTGVRTDGWGNWNATILRRIGKFTGHVTNR